MNRWNRPARPSTSPHRPLAALVLACSALSGLSVASAQVNFSATQFAGQPNGAMRTFPAQARRGSMEVVNAQQVRMNGTLVRLSPGSRIRSATNTLLTTGGLVGQTFLVNYTLDVMGQPHEIWILTEREAAVKRPGSEGVTTTNIVTETPR